MCPRLITYFGQARDLVPPITPPDYARPIMTHGSAWRNGQAVKCFDSGTLELLLVTHYTHIVFHAEQPVLKTYLRKNRKSLRPPHPPPLRATVPVPWLPRIRPQCLYTGPRHDPRLNSPSRSRPIIAKSHQRLPCQTSIWSSSGRPPLGPSPPRQPCVRFPRHTDT